MRELNELAFNIPTEVSIPGTGRKVSIKGIKSITIEHLTKLWMRRDMATAQSASDTLKSLCVDPYFSIKAACLFVLNGWLRIKLFYPIMWRVWACWYGYTEEQMSPIIAEAKKKLPLTAFWSNMAYLADMRMDWMKMTGKEAEQYRAELISAVNLLSSRNSRNTEGQDGASGATATGVS